MAGGIGVRIKAVLVGVGTDQLTSRFVDLAGSPSADDIVVVATAADAPATFRIIRVAWLGVAPNAGPGIDVLLQCEPETNAPVEMSGFIH